MNPKVLEIDFTHLLIANRLTREDRIGTIWGRLKSLSFSSENLVWLLPR